MPHPIRPIRTSTSTKRSPRPASPTPLHEEHHRGPHDPNEINPKLASDIAYWSHEFGVSGEKLHDAICTHGTHVAKIRSALHK